MLTFKQINAHPALRNYLRGYWLIEAGTSTETLELVPDGYPEIFFTLASSVQIFAGGNRWESYSQAGVIGQVTNRFSFEIAANSRVLYVKMYPWTPAILFNIPAWHLTNDSLEMSALTKDPGFRALSDQVYDTATFEQAVALLDAFFLKKLGGLAFENPFLQFAVRQIYASNGTASIDSLTSHIQASRRYVELLFKQAIGMSPKQYARLIRVKKATMLMQSSNTPAHLQTIAGALNYYDQSHFLKDFKAVVNQTPTQFLQQQRQFSLDDVRAYLGQWDYS